MAGVEVSHIIFFMAAVIMSISVVGIIGANVQDVTSASSGSARLLSNQLETDVTIINDPDEIPADRIFYVKNIGSLALDGNLTDVIIDGRYQSSSEFNITVIGRSDLIWEQTDVLNITLDTSISSGDHTIRVITQNGVSDEMDFNI